MLSFDSGEMFTRLHSAYYALEKVERMGLWFAVLPMCLFLTFVNLYERPPYIFIDVADMKHYWEKEIKYRSEKLASN